MNSKAEVQGTKGLDKNLDFLKWAAAGLLTMGGIFAFYHFSQYPTAYRAVALLPVVFCVFDYARWRAVHAVA